MVNFKQNGFGMMMILALVLGTFYSGSINAHNLSTSPTTLLNYDSPYKLKIKIVIIIIIKKKNVAEVVGTRLAGANEKLKENEFYAEAELSGGQLNLKVDDPRLKEGTVLVPEGLSVSKDVALKLGRSGSFKVKGGQIRMEENKLGNFEIQR